MKLDRGIEINKSKLEANEAFLDEHPSGFNRKGSMMDHYHRANSSFMSARGLEENSI